MWIIIFAVAMLSGLAAAVYMAHKVERTGIFDRFTGKAPRLLLAVLVVAAVVALLCCLFDVTNTIVIVIHLAFFLLMGDLVYVVTVKSFGKEVRPQLFDLAALIFCFIYMCIGWYLMHGLWETDYSLTTKKNVQTLRIAQIADSHVGTGFDGKGFGERLERIQQTAPDILVITGDFVDDDTQRSDMEDACAALGDFDAPYGKYFCFGNHDRGYYANERRGYSGDDLIKELEKNGVRVLQDESVLLDNGYYVIGRCDAGYGGSSRMSAQELAEGLDRSRYMIVLDHQPVDYEAEAEAGFDLVLSGHTHGGQLWPLEYVQPLLSENDRVRGHERQKDTDFIVTDGISDWAVKFKTGCRSEFNIIDVRKE